MKYIIMLVTLCSFMFGFQLEAYRYGKYGRYGSYNSSYNPYYGSGYSSGGCASCSRY